MPKPTQQEIAERYQKLPEALKDAIFSADIAAKMFEVGKKFGLTIEKTGLMAEETGYVILGLTRPNEFVQSLSGVLETEEDKTRAIANEINRQIFFPLREALKAAHQMEISEGEMQKSAAEKPFETRPVPSPIPTPPRPSAPSAPQPIPPLPAPPEIKPKPLPPPKPFELPGTKFIPPSPPIQPAPPKIPPLDLRPQAKPRPTESLPKPEIMGKGIFGAQPVINNEPKPPAPLHPPTEKPLAQKPPSSYDPYRESVE